eukprot:4237914-Alexandrium_andersonii.AAC.1
MGRGGAALSARAGECQGCPAVRAGLTAALGGLTTLGGRSPPTRFLACGGLRPETPWPPCGRHPED